MPDFQATDFSLINLAHVLEQFDYLALELKISKGRWARGAVLRSELHTPNGLGPGIEYQFAVFDPHGFEAAKTYLLHCGYETVLGRQEVACRRRCAHTTLFGRTLNLVHDCQIRRLCE